MTTLTNRTMRVRPNRTRNDGEQVRTACGSGRAPVSTDTTTGRDANDMWQGPARYRRRTDKIGDTASDKLRRLMAHLTGDDDVDGDACESCRCRWRRPRLLLPRRLPRPSCRPQYHRLPHRRRSIRLPSTCRDAYAKTNDDDGAVSGLRPSARTKAALPESGKQPRTFSFRVPPKESDFGFSAELSYAARRYMGAATCRFQKSLRGQVEEDFAIRGEALNLGAIILAQRSR